MKIALFYHQAFMGNHQEVTNDIFHKIKDSGLYKNIDFLCVNKLKDLSLYEFPTIEMLLEFAKKNEDYYILYLHTKGVSFPHSQPIKDWRDCMTYHMVTKWQECIEMLDDNNDVVGVNYRELPHPHFSGNFWWAKAKYLKTLPDVKSMRTLNKPFGDRHKCEFWLMQKEPKFKHWYHQIINPYLSCNPPSNYIK